MQSPWAWKMAGTVMLRSKKQTGHSGAADREYTLLGCPLGCGQQVEVLSSRLTKLRSIACRAHLRKCTKLSKAQRAAFEVDERKVGKSKQPPKQKPKRKKLPAPPVLEEGTTMEDYIESFVKAAKPTRLARSTRVTASCRVAPCSRSTTKSARASNARLVRIASKEVFCSTP
jgi:hypothetical protein